MTGAISLFLILVSDNDDWEQRRRDGGQEEESARNHGRNLHPFAFDSGGAPAIGHPDDQESRGSWCERRSVGVTSSLRIQEY
jgi:hypothetical protein